MKRIKPQELPDTLTPEIINLLAKMADETPQSAEIQEIIPLLAYADYRKVMDRKVELQKEAEKQKQDAMTSQEKIEESEKWEKAKNADPSDFFGNMGQAETPEEFKNRYGVYPPGYTGQKK